MSKAANDPIHYRVVYSERVRDELRKLLIKAMERGLGPPFRAAAAKLDMLLHTYPQFGDPLRDLSLESAQLWVGVVPPLVVRYGIHEEKRLVMVADPFSPLPRSGL